MKLTPLAIISEPELADILAVFTGFKLDAPTTMFDETFSDPVINVSLKYAMSI